MTTQDMENAIVSSPDEIKTCALKSCGKEFTRDNRRPSAWTKMRYCTARCANQQRANDSAERNGQGETKQCQREDCDELIVKTAGMSRSYWEVRKYHDRHCQAAAMRDANNQAMLATPPKKCENPECTNEMVFDLDDTKKNARSLFRRRKYCSIPCQMKCKREKRNGRLANQHRTQRPIKSSRKLASVGPVKHDIPDAPAGREQLVWRPAGFAPEPAIPGHIRQWNRQNGQEQQAS